MTITLAGIAGQPRTIPIEWHDETGTVTYRPDVVTPEFLARLDGVDWQNGYQASQALIDVLLAELVAWDVEAPLTREGLSTLPVEFLTTVHLAVAGDIGPGRPESETSAAG